MPAVSYEPGEAEVCRNGRMPQQSGYCERLPKNCEKRRSACLSSPSATAPSARLGPLPPHGDDSGHDRWSDKQSDQAERLQAAKDAEENPQERQASRRTDQRRADEMIRDEDHD